jgi:hypothetical protein
VSSCEVSLFLLFDFMGSRERRKCIYGVKDLEAHIAQTSNGTDFTVPVK